MRAHLIERRDIHNGPVDYSTPIGDAAVYWIVDLRDYLDRHKMPLNQTISPGDGLWRKLRAAGVDTELVHWIEIAPGRKSGQMYAQAIGF